ncbi:HNH endonuclease [Flavobacterium sp. LaA7.5]|nr:HNH endonuclease [Flavobacterium salilacus subsp. altitudinum]
MIDVAFRLQAPKRRTPIAILDSYREYRNDLMEDYLNRCGYCNSIDKCRNTWFEIDHFVPQKYLVTIKANDYNNLVYACRSCNNAKRAKWPTENELIPNKDNKGFIDPCDEEYDKQFKRTFEGRIIPTTDLGTWMYNALKLYKPQHEIIYNIDVLDKLIDEIEKELEVNPEKKVKDNLLEVYREFRKYVNKLSSAK